MVLIACFAWLAACKGDDPGSTRAAPGAGTGPGALSATPSGRADEVIRPGQDSAVGRALAGLTALEAPAIDKSPRCADYARNMSSFLAALGHEISRLRDQGKDGVSPEVLARFGAWLEDRAGALDQMSRSRALQETGELARLHRELVAAMRDLAGAVSAAYGASVAAPDSAEAARVDNAVANLRATFAALEAQCAVP